VLGPANVASLTQSWSTDVGAVVAASPVLASDVTVADGTRDLLYVGTEHGDLYALDAATGDVVWNRNLGSQQTACHDMPEGIFGITDTPAIDRATGTLYVAGGDGQLYALDLSTGTTLPGWPVTITADPAHEHVWSAITLTGGALYAETASYCDFTPYNGRVMKIDPTQPAVVDTWYVTSAPGAGFYGGGIWGWGGASVDPGGDLYIATGNAIADPEFSDYGEHVVRLSTALDVVASNAPGVTGGDVDFGSTPMPYQAGTCAGQIVVENKAGYLFVYDRDAIADGPTQSLAIADYGPEGELVGVPAWNPVTGMVYVSSPTDLTGGPYRHGLLAFSVGEDCMLHLAWQQTQGMNGFVVSSPTIANGVVYYGDGPGSEVLALAAATGDVLWRSADVITAGIWGTPIVVNGRLYVGAWDNAVHAFAPAP